MNINCKKNTLSFSELWMLSGLFIFLFGGYPSHAAEVNPYEVNYREQNTHHLKSLKDNPDTEIYVSNHKEDDNISMLEKGYDLIGTSGFAAFEASPDLALQHAKSIQADRVLVYRKYESAKTASSKFQLIKEAAKKGAEIDPNDLEDEPTQYQYFASYWAKLPTPSFGVHVIKLKQGSSNEPDASAVELPGLKVIAVIQESPAAVSNLQRGDTLLKMGEVSLTSAEDLFRAVKQYAGKTIPVGLQRNGQVAEVLVTLNARK